MYNTKAELRSVLATRRKAIADRLVLSEAACSAAATLIRGNVMVYVAIGSELDTSFLIKRLFARSDVNVYAPYTTGCDIIPKRLKYLGTPDKFGNLPECCYIIEKAPILLDFCITPLLGFNDKGFRIGYGKGCYDRFFTDNPCAKIGLAFEIQKQQFLPDPTDVPLDCCVTEKNVVYF